MSLTPRLDRLDKNYIINGNFDFWQRGTTFSPAASVYTADRWRMNSAINTCVRRDKTFSAGLPDGSQYGMHVTSLVSGGGFVQRIEAINLAGLAGKYLTLSFKAGLVSGTTQVFSRINIPTAPDNYTSRIFGTPIPMGTPTTHTSSYQTFSMSYLITPQMESNGIEISIEGDATVWSIIFSQVMLVVSPDNGDEFVPASFITAGRNYAEELQLCRRYYEKTYEVDTAPGSTTLLGAMFAIAANGGSQEIFTHLFRETKRATPAVTFYSRVTGAPNTIRYESGSIDVAQVASSISTNSFQNGSGGKVDGGLYVMHWTADAEI